MLSRALSLATALLLIGFATPSSIMAPAGAQNLEAGKSPAQLFAANCSVCHKSARGLLRGVPPGDLPGFLRQHYTTSSDMAKAVSAYVVANGAGGGRKPNDDGLTRRGRELTREQQPASGDAKPAAEAELPAGRKPKASKKNRRHHEEPPKADAVKDEAGKPEPVTNEAPKQTAPVTPTEEAKPAEAVKPEPKSEAAPATRTDPVPAVTPAPKEAEPSAPAPVPAPPPASSPSAAPNPQ